LTGALAMVMPTEWRCQRPMAEVGQECVGFIEPVVDGQVIVYLPAPLLDAAQGVMC